MKQGFPKNILKIAIILSADEAFENELMQLTT